jgi:hypothetical protein
VEPSRWVFSRLPVLLRESHGEARGGRDVSAYYNEFDPYAAEWLRNLIAAGHIAPGDVDERSAEA